ncbi:uncharacterized protein LOC110241821 [Exaiptasia diaphana]|uniref:MANSC domain-containing protein n=1 Tax=Exaiptasia diaphana TaxID=2652724 RepID=A0A913XEZ3_EXADI|nr:uncharacterized protein LOC110241821 [Exaiptasia diaphana]KXJ12632.1 Low-density lipoprotein receptor-related protein 11 [Exaiptasia diaphana]
MAYKYILSCIILASIFQAVFLEQDDGCPAIKVKKDQIIRTKEALNNGAKYLAKEKVESARECYKLCCQKGGCNLGMLSYKNDSNGHLVRTCYLFDCGSPSRCTFSSYKHYATITFEERKKDNPGKDETRKNTYNQPKPSNHRWNNGGCPEGVPNVRCYSNPCDTEICPSNPWATCKKSECGSCHAEFYNDDGDRVKCYESGSYHKPKPLHSTSSKWTQQDILRQIDRLQNNKPEHPAAHQANKNSNLETHLNQYTNNKPASHQRNSMPDDWDNKMGKKVTDPPLHEWRDFIDNNPKYAKPKLATKKPTRKPTTFHQWREFIDNNPKYTRPQTKPKTPKPTQTTTERTTEKTTQKTAHKTLPKTTKKMTKPHVIPKTKPAIEERPITYIPPKVDDQSRRAGNISDVVVIETSNLRIVENKAVVPLAIFLVVALILLFVVALRLRVMKSRLRRKAFATDDADYLINGMYL